MGPNNPWNDPKVAPPGFSLPVAIGPMTLPPQQPPKRRWRWLVAWTLFVFAGGLVAGPPVHDFTVAFFEDAAPKLAAKVPWLFGWLAPSGTPSDVGAHPGLQPSVVEGSPASPQAAPAAPAPSAEQAPSEGASAPAEPKMPRVEVRELAQAEQPAAPASPATPSRSRASKASSSPRSAAAPKSATGAVPVRKGAAADPFDSDPEATRDSSSTRKGRSSAGAAAKPEAPVRHASSRSSDSLDNLMADVATDGKGKGKKGVSRSIDDMLKDVQKSSPRPATKQEAPAAKSLDPLSPAEIGKAMGVVKTRANGCARRLGSSGIAELKITVAKTGKVSDVIVSGKLSGTPLGTCIEKAARAASFRPNAGLRFDYRLDAR